MTVAPGTRLGPYEITGKLGEGGMGEVWRATDTRLKREVAIKVLPAAFTADRERLARFEREAQLLAQLQHPHIASIYGLEDADGVRALVMELVEGPTLADRIAGGALPIGEALPIACQIAAALEAAHERGIVHRDLKPQNVKLTAEDSVKVLDFGLAKAVDMAGSGASIQDSPTLTVGATVQGVVLGTAPYMSPEQARGKPVDKRADIWAFGCVLYEMLTGRRGFDGETVSDVVAAVLRQDVDWSLLPADTPPAVERLLRRCLDRDPRQRLRDIGEARIALAVSPETPALRAAPAVAAAPARRRPSWPAIVAVAVLAALAVGAAFLVGRGRRAIAAPPVLAFTQKTFGSLAIFNARFGPDGQSIIFSAASAGSVPELFVLQGTYPEPRPLGLRDTHLLAVSSKGDLAVLTGAQYVSHRLFTGTLGVVPLGGQAVRPVLDNVREADWSADGSRLAVLRTVDRVDRLEYPAGKVLYRSTGYLSDLRIDPRGEHLAFFEHPLQWDDRGNVVVVDPAGKATTLASGFQSLEGLAWSGPGEITFTGTRAGGFNSGNVFAVDLRGRERLLLSSPSFIQLLDARPDGSWLLSRESNRNEIWAQLADAAAPVELSWLDTGSAPILSADGRRLLFTEQADAFGAYYAVCLRGTDGSPPVVLGEGEGTDLSPDGRWALAVVFSTPPKVVLYPTGTGERRVLDSGGLVGIQVAQWFPDGQSVLVLGNEKGRGARFYQLRLAGGPLRAITPEVMAAGGQIGRYLAPDGRSLIAQERSGAFERFAVDGGAPRPVTGLRAGDFVAHWTRDGQSLLVTNLRGVPVDVDRLDLRTGARTPFRRIASPDPSGVMAVFGASFSADDRSFAYVLTRTRSVLFTSRSQG